MVSDTIWRSLCDTESQTYRAKTQTFSPMMVLTVTESVDLWLARTFGLCSFLKSMKALGGFVMYGISSSCWLSRFLFLWENIKNRQRAWVTNVYNCESNLYTNKYKYMTHEVTDRLTSSCGRSLEKELCLLELRKSPFLCYINTIRHIRRHKICVWRYKQRPRGVCVFELMCVICTIIQQEPASPPGVPCASLLAQCSTGDKNTYKTGDDTNCVICPPGVRALKTQPAHLYI